MYGNKHLHSYTLTIRSFICVKLRHLGTCCTFSNQWHWYVLRNVEEGFKKRECKGLGLKMVPRLRECCRRCQHEVVSNYSIKIHQTWGTPFSRALYIRLQHNFRVFPSVRVAYTLVSEIILYCRRCRRRCIKLMVADMDLMMQYKDVGYKRSWILIMSAICLLSADCLLLFILADMDSLIQYKDVGYYEFWSCQLFVYSQLIVCFLSYLQLWTQWYNKKIMGMSKWILLISAACLVSADCILWLIILDMYSMIQSKDEQLWIMNFDHVSCLFTFHCRTLGYRDISL